jgi:hypothetical protein
MMMMMIDGNKSFNFSFKQLDFHLSCNRVHSFFFLSGLVWSCLAWFGWIGSELEMIYL